MQRKNNQTLGTLGENIAVKYLASNGYKIISKNFKTRYGEIDIIAKENNTLAFVEVRTRKSLKYGTPEESLTARKIRHLIMAVNYYRMIHPQLSNPIRIDLVSICLSANNLIKNINLYRNISS